MKKRFLSVIISFGITMILAIIIITLYSYVSTDIDGNKALRRVLLLLGGGMPAGIIQFFTFFLFFYALTEIYHLNKRIKIEEKAFNKSFLPEKENWILSPDDVTNLKLDLINNHKYDNSSVKKLILSVCTKFRANKSTSEALDMLGAQVKINKENNESEQSLIRYVAWAIPSVGFIGTVIGIANSLGAVKQNMSGDDLMAVTSSLNLAFDTTLVALFLSLILMYFFHLLTEKTDKFHTKSEQYILENLINRIYHS
jgi:biopolymer transport protein ExbB/TolQ